MMTAREIVSHYCQGRMSGRPEYFSGRGATLSDLNSDLLEMIYQGILKEIGKGGAQNFIKMVEDIDVLSATLFLNSLYELEARSWVWENSQQTSKASKHLDVGPEGEGRMAVGLASIGAWMGGGSGRDDTRQIRDSFLRAHGRKVKNPFRMYGHPYH